MKGWASPEARREHYKRIGLDADVIDKVSDIAAVRRGHKASLKPAWRPTWPKPAPNGRGSEFGQFKKGTPWPRIAGRKGGLASAKVWTVRKLNACRANLELAHARKRAQQREASPVVALASPSCSSPCPGCGRPLPALPPAIPGIADKTT
jgi:hypothetical protein